MLPVLLAEESMREAERTLVGRALALEHAAVVADRWAVELNRGDSPRRKAPPIPRELLGVVMGFEEVPSGHGR